MLNPKEIEIFLKWTDFISAQQKHMKHKHVHTMDRGIYVKLIYMIHM